MQHSLDAGHFTDVLAPASMLPGAPIRKSLEDILPLPVEQLATEIDQRLWALPGITAEPLHGLRREYSRRLARATAEEVVDLGLRLLTLPPREPRAGSLEIVPFGRRFLAYALVAHHCGALRSFDAAQLEQFGHGLDSWAAVDTFATYLAGPVWREHQVVDDVVYRWGASADRWWRRAALVSTVPLNSKTQGGTGDPVRTLAVCRLLRADRDDMVVKALSWALRELAKRDPAAVQQFLDEHREVLAARVLREVRNKLATGLKNPRGPGQA